MKLAWINKTKSVTLNKKARIVYKIKNFSAPRVMKTIFLRIPQSITTL